MTAATAPIRDALKIVAENRAKRLRRIKRGIELPVVLRDGAKLALHVQPLIERDPEAAPLDLARMEMLFDHFRLLVDSGCNYHFNVDGFVIFAERADPDIAYTQIFRDGTIESVFVTTWNEEKPESAPLSAVDCARRIAKTLPGYLKVFRALDIPSPVVASISLVGVAGRRVYSGSESGLRTASPARLPRDIVALQDVVIRDLSVERAAMDALLRPAFDVLWNAAGCPRAEGVPIGSEKNARR